MYRSDDTEDIGDSDGELSCDTYEELDLAASPIMETTTLLPVPGWPGVFVALGGRIYRELTAAPGMRGYTTVTTPQGQVRRHVLIALAHHGPPPPGCTQVRHLDDNPTNDDPGNLAWGTPADNVADAVRNGRTWRGERSTHVKLSLVQAQDIYDRRKAGEMGRELAAEFQVSEQTVCEISKGRTWPEVRRGAASNDGIEPHGPDCCEDLKCRLCFSQTGDDDRPEPEADEDYDEPYGDRDFQRDVGEL
jgi:hypothetical protein